MLTYRRDIDGLRAISVMSVIFFHFGFLKNGYLGVDVFFVISGYLITGIIYKDLNQSKFSIKDFYLKRIRRIIPLLLTIIGISFTLGVLFMLPDDLENLCQAIIASNLSINNILMLITSADYWAIKNEYKPLMHTWSLGIEEQFYLIYPILISTIYKFRRKVLLAFLVLISITSLVLFISQTNDSRAFYLLPYRVFELTLGGLCAILFNSQLNFTKYLKLVYPISIILLLLFILFPIFNNKINVVFVVFIAAIILTLGNSTSPDLYFKRVVLENRVFVFIGQISFSLYLWHQLILAFARYTYVEEFNLLSILIILITIFLLSILTFKLIEKPFRNPKIINTKPLLIGLSSTFILLNTSAFYIYSLGGIYKDFPNLDLYKTNVNRNKILDFKTNIHIAYNENVRKFEKDFTEKQNIKILIIGDSYGRDVFNILKESKKFDSVEIRYFEYKNLSHDSTIKSKWLNADMVILGAHSFTSKTHLNRIATKFKFSIDYSKFICFGTKDFGISNGIPYTQLKKTNKPEIIYARMKKGIAETENQLKREWQQSYISILDKLFNSQKEVKLFTNDGKFISQDTMHLTRQGAQYLANLLEKELIFILTKINGNSTTVSKY